MSERTFHKGDRVLWLPFWEDDPERAKPGVVTSTRKSLAPYHCAIRLDEDDHGRPTAAFASELRMIGVTA